MTEYMCMNCGATGSFYSFRGASPDGSYLKCWRCGGTYIIKKEDRYD